MKIATHHQIQLGARRVGYRVVRSAAAKRLRVRVGPAGIEVIQPVGRTGDDVSTFLSRNAAWLLNQLRRAERLRSVRRPKKRNVEEILFRGVPTRVRVEESRNRARCNMVAMANGEILVYRGGKSSTLPYRSLETWLRKQARDAIAAQLTRVTAQLRQQPARVYVMGQRTKWGNCSSRRNLSFNWRLILAPDFVLRYLVTHEAAHLAVPDHSAKFWLMVQSLCPETERAKQWLSASGGRLLEPLLLHGTG